MSGLRSTTGGVPRGVPRLEEFCPERREYASRWAEGNLRTPGVVWVEADAMETTLYFPVEKFQLVFIIAVLSSILWSNVITFVDDATLNAIRGHGDISSGARVQRGVGRVDLQRLPVAEDPCARLPNGRLFLVWGTVQGEVVLQKSVVRRRRREVGQLRRLIHRAADGREETALFHALPDVPDPDDVLHSWS